MQDKMEEKIMIAPSIMCISEWHDTKNIFRQLKENGIAMIHADVMDGKFVPNLMLGTESIKHLREVTDIPLDIHMMVEKPEEKLDWLICVCSRRKHKTFAENTGKDRGLWGTSHGCAESSYSALHVGGCAGRCIRRIADDG